MEKSPSPSAPGKAPTGNTFARDITPQLIGTEPRKRVAAAKPSREEVSRCIGIWAKLYHLRDEDADAQELCMPSRTWMGRSSSGLKRFE